jgi:hypothetical protein
MNQVSGAPMHMHSESHSTFPRSALEVHLTPFFYPLPEGTLLITHACNKYNSIYTMRSVTRVQVLEFWPIRCGSFCARKRKKWATWLQEEEYSEWVTRLHWISLHGKGLCKGVCDEICSEWTKDALRVHNRERLSCKTIIIQSIVCNCIVLCESRISNWAQFGL